MSATTISEQANPWEITTRTIVYSAIGAALYAVAGLFEFTLPGTANVSLRPAFALVTFFGFAFGPIPGLFVGLVGNAIHDQIAGYGLLTYWDWSLANGLAGFVTGLVAWSMVRSMPNKIALAAVASVIGVVIGFVAVFLDMIIGTAATFGVALTANYLPAVIGDVIVAVILTPILVAAWEPVRESLGR
jgi:energy-coupling factor transport system substrate-specific component